MCGESTNSHLESIVVGLSQTLFRSAVVVGDFALFIWNTILVLPSLFRRRGMFFRQCEFIGVSSTGIVIVAGIFMGAVLGYELWEGFHWFGAEALLGASVGVALFRDLAAVMGAFMVTGRAGAAMAAELASMRISEQIDALEVMGVDPMEYLVAPRVFAGLLMMPLLGVFFAAVASVSAAGVACGIMDLSYATYWEQYTKYVDFIDVTHCLVKSAFFGLILTWVGCFSGFRARGGAHSVGLAARTTVVASFLIILIWDYVLTSMLPVGQAYMKVT